MALTFDHWLRVGSLIVSVESFLFSVFQWRKRARLHVKISAFLYGLNAATDVAKVEPIVIKLNDRLTKLNMHS